MRIVYKVQYIRRLGKVDLNRVPSRNIYILFWGGGGGGGGVGGELRWVCSSWMRCCDHMAHKVRHLGDSGGMLPQEFFFNSKVSGMDSGAI